MSDEPLKRCPKCRCKVKRLIGSGAGIIFKGSGFYETDYRSKSYSEAKKKEETSSSSTKSKASKSNKSAKKDK
jgi:predicted nucleic acid-binding Zn ribbon protein